MLQSRRTKEPTWGCRRRGCEQGLISLGQAHSTSCHPRQARILAVIEMLLPTLTLRHTSKVWKALCSWRPQRQGLTTNQNPTSSFTSPSPSSIKEIPFIANTTFAFLALGRNTDFKPFSRFQHL